MRAPLGSGDLFPCARTLPASGLEEQIAAATEAGPLLAWLPGALGIHHTANAP